MENHFFQTGCHTKKTLQIHWLARVDLEKRKAFRWEGRGQLDPSNLTESCVWVFSERKTNTQNGISNSRTWPLTADEAPVTSSRARRGLGEGSLAWVETAT